MIRCPARLVYLGFAGALALAGLSLSQSARAAEPEQVVVRNRAYRDSGRFELQLNYSFNLAPGLTQMQAPVLDLAYHIDSAWSVDLIVGYFFGGATDLFGQTQCPGGPGSGGTANCTGAFESKSIFYQAAQQMTAGSINKQFSDAPGLWFIDGLDAQLGVRWEPVYGKLSLLSAVPVHFTWYFGIDGGVADFSRDSVSYCTNYDGAAAGGKGDCQAKNGKYQTLHQTRWSWLASAATGLRFVFLKQASINAGLREYVWQDDYQSKFCVNDSPADAPNAVGTCPANSKGTQTLNQASGPLAGISKSGITATLFADLGLSWTF